MLVLTGLVLAGIITASVLYLVFRLVARVSPGWQKPVDIFTFVALSAAYLVYEAHFGAGKKADIRIDLFFLFPFLVAMFAVTSRFLIPWKWLRVLLGITWMLALIFIAHTYLWGYSYGR